MDIVGAAYEKACLAGSRPRGLLMKGAEVPAGMCKSAWSLGESGFQAYPIVRAQIAGARKWWAAGRR